MNIYAEKGDKVIFAYPSAGYEGDRETAQKYLTVGKTYTIERTSVDRNHTSVYLEGFPGVAFNSVIFNDEPESRTKRGREKGIPMPTSPYCEANYPKNCTLKLAEEKSVDLDTRKANISILKKLCVRCGDTVRHLNNFCTDCGLCIVCSPQGIRK